jgi:hypothetical protein
MAAGMMACIVAAMLALSLGCGDEETPPAPAPAPEPRAEAQQPMDLAPERVERKRRMPEPGASPAEELRADAPVPDFYPGDAPRYPGATASYSAQTPDGKANILFGSEDSVDEVARFMADTLPDEGWDTDGMKEAPSGVLIEGRKGGREIAVMIRRINEGAPDAITMIAVTVDPS